MYALAFGTKDGYVELLLLPSMMQIEPSNCTWRESDGESVTGYFLTGELPLDSYDSVKQLRRSMFMHSSGSSTASILAQYYYRDMDGKMFFNHALLGGGGETYSYHNIGEMQESGIPLFQMPATVNDVPDYRTPPTRFKTIAVEGYVFGKAHIKNILLEYRSLRD